jgi:hypothetical protein
MARIAERLVILWIILRTSQIEGAHVVSVTSWGHCSDTTEGNNSRGAVLPHSNTITIADRMSLQVATRVRLPHLGVGVRLPNRPECSIFVDCSPKDTGGVRCPARIEETSNRMPSLGVRGALDSRRCFSKNPLEGRLVEGGGT